MRIAVQSNLRDGGHYRNGKGNCTNYN